MKPETTEPADSGIPCTRCHGTGTIVCGICNGRGKNEGGLPCAACNGKGHVPCSACNGTGKQTQYHKQNKVLRNKH